MRMEDRDGDAFDNRYPELVWLPGFMPQYRPYHNLAIPVIYTEARLGLPPRSVPLAVLCSLCLQQTSSVLLSHRPRGVLLALP